MTDDKLARWTDVEQVLDQVLDLDPSVDRRAYARALCGADADLAHAVDDVLRATPATLDSGSASALAAAALEEHAEAPVPRTVGPFRVLSELGRGGMGRVFVAVRDEPGPHPRVALKVVDRFVDTAEARRRFARERETLARLDHPHIARLYDGGVTVDGVPYLAMELVEGQSIDAHCDQQHLGLTERVRLMCDVCRAVTYAHTRLVVHRDLKPANVMVDVHGQVKLLDFGIAKWLDEIDAERPLTATVHRVLTPSHASPEQFLGEPITAATDVYQLGLLLYRLLVGRRAHAVDSPTPEAVRRAVCEVDPPRPSVAVAAPPTEPVVTGADSVPAEHQAYVGTAWARWLRGDLDAIVMRALRKSPRDRYATVADLQRDLESFLAHRPVSARQGSWLYAARKYARRHRAPLAAAASLVVASAAGVVGVVVQGRVAATERDRAVAAEGAATAVNSFLVNELLASATPDRSQETTPTVADVLENAARSVGFALSATPAVEAQMRETLARSFLALGRHQEAHAQAEAAHRLLAGRHAPTAPETLKARRLLVEVRLAAGQYAGLLDESRAVLRGVQQALGPSHAESLLTQATLGRVLARSDQFGEAATVLLQADAVARGPAVDFDTRVAVRGALLDALLSQPTKGREAEPLAREHLEDLRHRYGASHPRLVPAGAFLVRSLIEQLKYEEAVTAAEAQVQLHENLYGATHVATATAVHQLSVAYDRASRDDQSAQAAERALEIFRRTAGPDHPRTMSALRNVAISRRRNGQAAEALPLYRQVYDTNHRTLGERHPTTIRSLTEQIPALIDLHRLDEARAVATQALARYARAAAAADADAALLVDYGRFLTEVEPADLSAPERAIPLFERAVTLTGRRELSALRSLAFAYGARGDDARALALAFEVMALPEGIESWTTEQFIVKTLRTLDPERVEPWLLERLETLRRVRGPNEYLQVRTLGHLADWAYEHGRPAEAEARMRQQLDVLVKSAPPDHFYVFTVKSDLGALLLERGAMSEAEPLLKASYDGHLASRRFSHRRRELARDRLADLYEKTGRPAEAREVRARALPVFPER